MKVHVNFYDDAAKKEKTGEPFEDLVRMQLSSKNGPISFENRICALKKEIEYTMKCEDLKLGGCSDKKKTDSGLINQAFQNPMILYYSTSITHELFDTCYYNEKEKLLVLVQMTQGEKHDSKQAQLIEVDNLINKKATKVLLLHAVPASTYDKFFTNPRNPKLAAKSSFDIRIIKVNRNQKNV